MTIPAWIKGTLVLGATATAGIVIGMAFERHHSHSAPPAVTAMAPHVVMHRLQHNLHLDSAQHAAIAAILARRQSAVDSTWHAMQPHVRATLDSTLQEIIVVLRPDQVAKYREMVEVMHPGLLTKH